MRSDTVKKGFQRAPHRGLLHACGLSTEDIGKPFIGIANSFCEIVPGHVHLDKVAKVVKDSVRRAGGGPFEFNTIAVCDGVAMGHTGMKYSLASREIIAGWGLYLTISLIGTAFLIGASFEAWAWTLVAGVGASVRYLHFLPA